MDYQRPDRLEAALSRLAAGPCAVLAGGTDLFARTERPALSGPVLDVTAVAGLRGITADGGGLRIGGATTWSDLIRADLPPALDGLRAAAREVGSIQIQNRGTVAGNLVNASPAADGVPPLLTLEAEVELRSVRGTRRLGLAAFLTGPRRTARAQDELLTAVLIPAAGLAGRGAFAKLGARRHLVISIAMAAVRLEMSEGRIAAAALAIGACSAVATRLPAAEAAVLGAPVGRAAAALTDEVVAVALAPLSDIRGDAAYRSRAAAEILRRAVAAAAEPDSAEAAA